jgi:uncharacterized protein (TIGR04255 family)
MFDTQPRIEPVIESLTSQTPGPPQIQAIVGPPGTRFDRAWLISADDSTLLQLQDNTFAVNWRHRNSAYPRFEFIENRLLSNFDAYRSLFLSKGVDIQVRQIEITYINWLLNKRPEDFLKPAEVSNLEEQGLGQSEDQVWMARYRIHEGSNAIGRLLVQCQPAMRLQSPFSGSGYQFAPTFKVPTPPGTFNDDRLRDIVEMGHDKIVRAFNFLTTDSAREEWGEKKMSPLRERRYVYGALNGDTEGFGTVVAGHWEVPDPSYFGGELLNSASSLLNSFQPLVSR